MIETLPQILRRAINPALRLLPHEMTSDTARGLLLCIGLQESGFETREQYGGGPARGFWQFEQGTEASHGGVWGVYAHPASSGPLQHVCRRRRVEFDPVAIYNTLALDDILAAAVARLLIYTDPYSLPFEQDDGWVMYAERTWRPGKPRPDDWPDNWGQAVDAMSEDAYWPARLPTFEHGRCCTSARRRLFNLADEPA
jgi:hypothetical protein